jgi:predicted nucleic acid-binding protein
VSDVLIDSSVWIDFFRGDRAAVARIDPLIADDRAAVSGPIVAEVASGAKTLATFNLVRARLLCLTLLADPPDLWDRAATARFMLARQGTQANLIDLAIAISASVRAHRLLTRDRDFVAIAKVIPLELDLL